MGVNEGAEGSSAGRTGHVGDGGCEGRLQQRVGPGSVRHGGGVLQKGVVPVVDTVFSTSAV